MNISILMVITFSLLILHVVLRRNSHNGVMLKNGKNFSSEEKKKILKVLDGMEKYYQMKNMKGVSYGMCNWLQSEINYSLYDKLFSLYHNPRYYQGKGLKLKKDFTLGGYWWSLSDSSSRVKATLILKDAVIND